MGASAASVWCYKTSCLALRKLLSRFIQIILSRHTRGDDLSFHWLRSQFGEQKSADIYRSLDYGRTIIGSKDQLNQYLYSYGPMIASQWDVASSYLAGDSVSDGARWIDYGCGQGLAGLLIRERLGAGLLDNVRTTVLVEPSIVALRRAEAIYRFVTPNSEIFGVPSAFNDLLEKDLRAPSDRDTIHVFSNVLDISGYNHLNLLKKGLSPGRHFIIAVGHDRDHNGGSHGVAKLKAELEHPNMSPQISVHASTLQTFNCKNRNEPAILWYCQLDVKNG